MSTTATVMMVVSILLVWGGLVASMLFMRARPQVHSMEDPDLVVDDNARGRLRHPDRDR